MRDPLLATVLEDPSDVGALRVYADRLIEEGDARGELINVQCALVQLSDDAAEGPALRRRERELLAAMPQIDGVELLWRHGMIAGCAGPAETVIDTLAKLGKREPIVRLALDQPEHPWRDPGNEPVRDIPLGRPTGERSLRRLLQRPWLARVESLGLAHHELGAEMVKKLFVRAKLPRLRALDLRTSEIVPDTFDALHRCDVFAGLEELAFENDHPTYHRKRVLDERTIAALVGDSTLPLRKLALSGVLYANGGLKHFVDELALEHLEDLDLSDNSNGVHADDLKALAKHPCAARLRRLDLSRSGEGSFGGRVGTWLPPLAKLPLLEELYVANNVMYGMKRFASVAWPRLKRLDFSEGALQKEDLNAFVKAEMPSLVDLVVDLSWLQTAKDLLPLGKLRWPLQRLHVPSITIDERVVAAIARTVGPTLRDLSLSDAKGLDARTLAAFCEAGFRRLERLDLTETDLDEDCVHILATSELPNLYHLRITERSVSVAALRERFGEGLELVEPR